MVAGDLQDPIVRAFAYPKQISCNMNRRKQAIRGLDYSNKRISVYSKGVIFTAGNVQNGHKGETINEFWNGTFSCTIK